MALCDIEAGALQDTSSLLKGTYPDVELLLIEMDTSHESAVDSAIAQTVTAFGRIDIAFNNAGVGGAGKRTHDTSLPEWQRVVDINLKGLWLCHRAEIRQMLNQEPLSPGPRGARGVIVNMASVLGLVAAPDETPACAYAAAKHGVVGLTKTDGIIYAPQKVRINAICPGYVATPLIRKFIVSSGRKHDNVLPLTSVRCQESGAEKAEGMRHLIDTKVPVARLAEMEEIADAVVFLSSPMASFMAGASMAVDGGYSAQ